MRQYNFKLIHKNVLLLLGCSVAMQAAHAAYPEKPVHWIIPGAAGGAADAVARIVATAVSARWGKPIIVENRPGATGTPRQRCHGEGHA